MNEPNLIAKKSLHLRAIMILCEDLLDPKSESHKDERVGPELRDIYRLSLLKKPRTTAGKAAFEVAKRII